MTVRTAADLPADFGKIDGKDHPDSIIANAATAAERERCAEAVMRSLREIGASPGSSIDSALALVLRKIHHPET